MAWSEAEARPTQTQPYELLDDGFAPEPCELLVIGCGNIMRGDDAVGPVLIRTLFTRGVPDGVRIVDGGTAGMDVAFGMRGAARVVIIDVEDPVELGHVARSFDSCLVCTVHAYDGKTGRELNKFVINGMV